MFGLSRSLVWLLIFPLIVAGRMCEAADTTRPNILLITTDYQAGTDGPSLGSPFLQMPALDRLCREGAVFTRYFSTAPICMPARYTLISGTYPHRHGMWDNGGHWLPEGSPVLMELLGDVGYNTVGIGKMHFAPWDRMAGFDRRIIADRKGGAGIDDDYAKFLRANGFEGNRLYAKAEAGAAPGVYDWPHDEKFHIDAYVGDQARGVIERDELTGPWFLWVSFNGPHNPWDPPAKYSEQYKKMQLPTGNTFPGELKTKPTDHTRLRYNYTRNVVEYMDQNPERREAIVRRIRAGHYGNLTFIDNKVQGILDALEKAGQLDKTAIIYTSDHGAHLGDHNLIHKGTHYDSSARVPFVVRYPAKVKPRRVSGFAGHIDLLPTLLSLAGASVPKEAEGVDLMPLLTGEADSVQDHAIIEIRGATSIVTDRWKMAVHPADAQGDLYDLKSDPAELRNLYYDPEYAEVRTKLTARLIDFRPELAAQLKKAKAKQHR